MDTCGRCGRRPVTGGWCAGCGQPAGAPFGPGPGVVAGSPAGRPVSVPPLLWAAIAGFGVAALLTLGGALSSLSAAGLYGLLSLLIPLVPTLALPAAYTAVAVGLYRGARAARPAGAVVGLTALVAVPAGGFGSPAMVLGALLAVLAAVPPVLVPGIRAWFDGPWGSRPAQAPSITVARTILAVLAGITAAGALVALLAGIITLASTAAVASSASSTSSELGDAFGGLVGVLGGAFGGATIVGALVGAGMAALGFWARAAVGARSRGARVVVTVVSGLVVVGSLLTVIAGAAGAVTTAHLVLDLALVVLLWVPTDARQHFAEPPLPLVEHLRAQLVHGVERLAAPGVFGPGAGAPAFGAPSLGGPSFGGPSFGGSPGVSPFGGSGPVGGGAPGMPGTAGPTLPAGGPTAPTVGLAAVAPTSRHARADTSCPRCGAPTTPGWQHCGHCGTALAGA